MFRTTGLMLATIGVLALAMGCSDDDTKKDTGGVKLDGSGVTLDQGAGPEASTPDQATTTPDKSTPVGDGPSVAKGAFGSVCNLSSKTDCNTGLLCSNLQGGSSTKGFCTKKCTNSGKACTGGPTGTAPYCAMKDTKGNLYCIFICLIQSTTKYPCPNGLSCGTATQGQAACLVK